jgi:hypothetical protein
MFWESRRREDNQGRAKIQRRSGESASETNAYPPVPDSEMTIEETEVIDLLVSKSPLLIDSA